MAKIKRSFNPIQNIDVINYLVDSYCKSTFRFNAYGNSGLYNYLTDYSNNKEPYSLESLENFYINRFNRWLSENGINRTCSSWADVKKIESICSSKNIKTWRTGGDSPSYWEFVISKRITGGKENSMDITKRIYISPNNKDLHKLADVFIKKCENNNLPYYLKFPIKPDGRKDSLVVYADNENFGKYLGILKDIKKEYPEIAKHCAEPPILSSNFNGWLGLADEPNHIFTNNKNYSFNQVRALAVENGIEEATVNNLQNLWNKNSKIKKLFAEEIFDAMKRDRTSFDFDGNRADVMYQIENKMNQIINFYTDARDRKLSIFEPGIANETTNTSVCSIEVGSKKYNMPLQVVDESIKAIIPVIKNSNSNYAREVQQCIIDNCSKLGISKKCFSFNEGFENDKYYDLNGNCVFDAKEPDVKNSEYFSNKYSDANTKYYKPDNLFKEMKKLFETYKVVEKNGVLAIENRNNGLTEKLGENPVMDNIIAKTVFADNWVKATISNVPRNLVTNEFGIDEYAYDYCFNDGAKSVFNSIIKHYDQVKNGKDLYDLAMEIKAETKYKYALPIVKSILMKPNRTPAERSKDSMFGIFHNVKPESYNAIMYCLNNAHKEAKKVSSLQNGAKLKDLFQSNNIDF